jgi:hypothetical protein
MARLSSQGGGRAFSVPPAPACLRRTRPTHPPGHPPPDHPPLWARPARAGKGGRFADFPKDYR